MESQYIDLLHHILRHGRERETRNGIVKSMFGATLECDLADGFPLLTTKKMFWRGIVEELSWFLRGSTNVQELRDKKVHIWDGNSATRNYDAGPVYGFQWRHFNANYSDCNTDYSNKGIDQLKYIIKELKNPETRNSRRLILSAWNPCQLHLMALPPCHVMCQFNVLNNKLSCSLYQRSGDVGLGVPFNIASYSLLTHLIAHHTGLEAYDFVYFLGNAHIYDDHVEKLKIQKDTIPQEFPKLKISKKYKNIQDYTVNDFIIENYNYASQINLLMRQ